MEKTNSYNIRNKRIEHLIGYAWVLQIAVQALSGWFGYIGINSQIITILLFVPLFIGIIMNYKTFMRVISINDILMSLFMLVVVCLTSIIRPENFAFVETNIFTILLFVVYYLLAKVSAKTDGFREVLWRVSIIGISLMYFAYFTSLRGSVKSMTFAYALVAQVVPAIDALSRKKNLLYLITSFLGIILLFLLGTRGPLLCTVVYIAYKYLFISKHRKWHMVLFSLISAFVFYLITSDLYLDLLRLCNTLLLKNNIRSYIVEQIVTQNYASSLQRVNMFDDLWSAILNKPILGYGLWGDRFLLGTYAHNIILEILTQHGFFFGGIFILGLLYLILKSFFINKDKSRRECLIIIFICCFDKFFVSSSYLNDYYFYFFLGYFVQSLVISKKHEFRLASKRDYLINKKRTRV